MIRFFGIGDELRLIDIPDLSLRRPMADGRTRVGGLVVAFDITKSKHDHTGDHTRRRT